jgi:hypothetical protein
MVRKRGAGLVGYDVECLDFVCTIYYHHRHVIARARVVWWWMKITPDKDLNYRKKNFHFNLSTIPIGVADFVSVVNGFGELLAGTLHVGIVSARRPAETVSEDDEKKNHMSIIPE